MIRRKSSLGRQMKRASFIDRDAFFQSAINMEKILIESADDSSSYKGHEALLSNDAKMIEVAKMFLDSVSPETLKIILAKSGRERDAHDRLIKIGRSIVSTRRLGEHDPDFDEEKVDATLDLTLHEAERLAEQLSSIPQEESKPRTTKLVPKVRFGKTELQMPILTLGCMRFQQSWNNRNGPVIRTIDQVEDECQENLVAIMKYAIANGCNHIETAASYGCSEIQIGEALQVLFKDGFCNRDELILQTKGMINASMTREQLRAKFISQLERLKVEYVDLFSIHGLNVRESYDWVFDNPSGNLMDELLELKKEGKIRHIGFSTHASAPTIGKMIESNQFDYVNLHYHFCGSYTASGTGMHGGNLENIRILNEKDMGVFIISAYDKGGALYAPSNKLRSLTLPHMEPMTYGSVWLWSHHIHDGGKSRCHTIVCGAARPSDLDQPILAALEMAEDMVQETMIAREAIDIRMKQAASLVLDRPSHPTFSTDWYKGLKNHEQSKYVTMIPSIVWIANVVKAYGLHKFGKDRYQVLINNSKKWDNSKDFESNLKALGAGWQWTPGCAYDESLDYTDDLADVPPEHREVVIESMKFVHSIYGASKAKTYTEDNDQEEKTGALPFEFETAYDMRPWTAFPER